MLDRTKARLQQTYHSLASADPVRAFGALTLFALVTALGVMDAYLLSADLLVKGHWTPAHIGTSESALAILVSGILVALVATVPLILWRVFRHAAPNRHRRTAHFAFVALGFILTTSFAAFLVSQSAPSSPKALAGGAAFAVFAVGAVLAAREFVDGGAGLRDRRGQVAAVALVVLLIIPAGVGAMDGYSRPAPEIPENDGGVQTPEQRAGMNDQLNESDKQTTDSQSDSDSYTEEEFEEASLFGIENESAYGDGYPSPMVGEKYSTSAHADIVVENATLVEPTEANTVSMFNDSLKNYTPAGTHYAPDAFEFRTYHIPDDPEGTTIVPETHFQLNQTRGDDILDTGIYAVEEAGSGELGVWRPINRQGEIVFEGTDTAYVYYDTVLPNGEVHRYVVKVDLPKNASAHTLSETNTTK